MRDRLAEITGGTHLRIDLDAYQRNIRQLRTLAGANRQLTAVVKANAYGHGALACSEAAIDAGASLLAVARIDEGIQLRRGGISAPVLVLGSPNLAQAQVAIEHDIALSVGTSQALEAVTAAGQRTKRKAIVHLKVESGLHRYGARPEIALDLARRMSSTDWIDFAGIYSHFSSADEVERAPTQQQLDIMRTFIATLSAEQLLPPHVHLANSAAIFSGAMGPSTMVRAGIATYGLNPSDKVTLPDSFEPVMALHSVISRRFQLRPGDGVSYGRLYVSSEVEEAATVPVGYADGLPRNAWQASTVSIGGRSMPILGRICMDQLTVRAFPETSEGDPVVVFGSGRIGEPTADDIAGAAGENNYEVVTRMSARLPRLYYRAAVPDSWAIPILGESGHF